MVAPIVAAIFAYSSDLSREVSSVRDQCADVCIGRIMLDKMVVLFANVFENLSIVQYFVISMGCCTKLLIGQWT